MLRCIGHRESGNKSDKTLKMPPPPQPRSKIGVPAPESARNSLDQNEGRIRRSTPRVVPHDTGSPRRPSEAVRVGAPLDQARTGVMTMGVSNTDLKVSKGDVQGACAHIRDVRQARFVVLNRR